MQEQSWALALAELIYFIPSSIPVTYCLWKHRRTGLAGWTLLLAFVLLQLIGSGLTVSAGQHGKPSSTAIIITSVGLSPLMLGLAGVVHEWTKVAGMFSTKGAKKYAMAAILGYHVLVVGAIAIYAIGASDAFQQPPKSGGEGMFKAGIVLLLMLFLALCGVFGYFALKFGTKASRPLFWSITLSLLLLALRILYQVAATFSTNPALSPVDGDIAYKVVFQFLPGALILLAMVTGGVMSIKSDYQPARSDVLLNTRDMESGSGSDVARPRRDGD